MENLGPGVSWRVPDAVMEVPAVENRGSGVSWRSPDTVREAPDVSAEKNIPAFMTEKPEVFSGG